MGFLFSLDEILRKNSKTNIKKNTSDFLYTLRKKNFRQINFSRKIFVKKQYL